MTQPMTGIISEHLAASTHKLNSLSADESSFFLELSNIAEQSREKNDSESFIKELLADHESIIIYLRENINHITNEMHDAGTGDFITGIMETHEKIA